MPFDRMRPPLAGVLVLLFLAACSPAAGQQYHPDDVATINRILTINSIADEKIGEDGDFEDEDEFFVLPSPLALAGWVVDHPETWKPFENEDIYHEHEKGRAGGNHGWPSIPPRRIANGIIWKDSRIVGLTLVECGLSGILDLGGMTRLEHLNVDGNSLEGFAGLGTLVNLRSLDAWRNDVSDPGDLGELSKLTRLNLGSNRLETIEGLNKLINLTFLDIGGADFVIPDLSGLTRLRTLKVLSRNDLSKSDFSAHPELEHLVIDYTRKNGFRVGLSNLNRLKTLDLGGSPATALDGLSCFGTLSGLYLNDSILPDGVDLSRMKALKILDIRGLPSAPRIMDTLPDGLVEELRIDNEYFPVFRLKEQSLGRLKRLYVRIRRDFAELDLTGHALDYLKIVTPYAGATERVTPERFFADEGSIVEADFQGSGYTLTELRALHDKILPRIFMGLGNHAKLGDVSGDFKVGTPYAPAQLSPRLAEEFEAAGEGATIVAFGSGAVFIDLNSPHPFRDGKLTFTSPGDRSVLIVADRKGPGGERAYFRVIYKDSFNVVE